MNIYGVDLGTEEPLVIIAKTIQDARESIIQFGVKHGYSKHWRENCNIESVAHDCFGVYKLY